MSAGLSIDELLALWERGRGADPLRRGLILLEAALPGRGAEELAAAPIGRRDAALVALRTLTFGPRAECFVACPACASELEFELDLPALAPPPPADGEGPWSLSAEGWELRFRLPGSADLARAAGEADPEQALLASCVLAAACGGGTAAPEAVPRSVVSALEAEMARLDPLANVSLSLRCAACGEAWSAPFDVGDFLWREIEFAAKRALREVDALARAYGWSEREILALSPARRRAYLELAGAL